MSFHEKAFCPKGFINGGVYCLKRELLDEVRLKKFSFERDFLEKGGLDISAFESRGYFIDIGIPEDYERAQLEWKEMEVTTDENTDLRSERLGRA